MGITRLRQGRMLRDGFMRGRCTLGSSQDMLLSRGSSASHVQRGLYSDVLLIQRQRQGDLRLLLPSHVTAVKSTNSKVLADIPMLVNAEFHKRFANTYVPFRPAGNGLNHEAVGLPKTTDAMGDAQRSWLADLSWTCNTTQADT